MDEIDDGEMIFESGDWGILQRIHRVCGSHMTCKSGSILSWFDTDYEPVCLSCGEDVPEEIQGLVYMMESF